MSRVDTFRFALVAIGVAALPACGFPGLQYADGDDAAADATTDASASDDATGDARTPDGAGPDALASNEASASDAAALLDGQVASDAAPDAIAVPDASPDAPVNPTDAGHDAGIDCDQDKDGYRALACEGGTDCCDTDPSAHPTQAMFFASQDNCLSWDYDCDGKIETEILVNITCSGTGLTGCTGGPGFTSDPACGAMAPYSSCVGSGALACSASSTMMATQACH
jgi:hypothetical protein